MNAIRKRVSIRDKDQNKVILIRVEMNRSEWQTIGKTWCYDITLTYIALTANNFVRFLGKYCEVWLRERMLYGKIEQVNFSGCHVQTIIREVTTTYSTADFGTLISTQVEIPMRIIQYHG